jgi:hypothetical protein
MHTIRAMNNQVERNLNKKIISNSGDDCRSCIKFYEGEYAKT